MLESTMAHDLGNVGGCTAAATGGGTAGGSAGVDGGDCVMVNPGIGSSSFFSSSCLSSSSSSASASSSSSSTSTDCFLSELSEDCHISDIVKLIVHRLLGEGSNENRPHSYFFSYNNLQTNNQTLFYPNQPSAPFTK
eukprot:GHVQ01025403.1.p1 GENE.GHVQ01025403.1~~GHVQ01025403.1.p1  ORF type:complete len:137 (+),score=44.19 GHVQ01025403.1:369-779(+)